MGSRLRLIATLTVLPATFGTVWLASIAALGGTPGTPTLAAHPATANPGEQVTLSGQNYECGTSAQPDLGASGGPASSAPASSAPASSAPASPAPTSPALTSPAPTSSAGPGGTRGWVGVLLGSIGVGKPVQPDSNNALTLTVALPADITPGTHTLATRCENSSGDPISGILAHTTIQVVVSSITLPPGHHGGPGLGGAGPSPHGPRLPPNPPQSGQHPAVSPIGHSSLPRNRARTSSGTKRHPRHPATRVDLTPISWIGGSLAGLVILVLIFGRPLARSLNRRPGRWWLAGKPRLTFSGRDPVGSSVDLSYGRPEASFAIGIQVRLNALGYEGHVEVTP
jgi:hypothetical protein